MVGASWESVSSPQGCCCSPCCNVAVGLGGGEELGAGDEVEGGAELGVDEDLVAVAVAELRAELLDASGMSFGTGTGLTGCDGPR